MRVAKVTEQSKDGPVRMVPELSGFKGEPEGIRGEPVTAQEITMLRGMAEQVKIKRRHLSRDEESCIFTIRDKAVEALKRLEGGKNGRRERELNESVLALAAAAVVPSHQGITRKRAANFAKIYRPRHFSVDDLAQEASISMFRWAMGGFDHTTGNRFTSYAKLGTLQAMERAMDTNDLEISRSNRVNELLRRINRFEASYMAERGQKPSVEEIAVAMDVKPEAIVACTEWNRKTVSLNKRMKRVNGKGRELQAVIPDANTLDPEKAVIRKDRESKAWEMLTVLSGRQQEIIRKRYGLDDGEEQDFTTIGNALGVSRQRVTQLEAKALEKMRKAARIQGWKDGI